MGGHRGPRRTGGPLSPDLEQTTCWISPASGSPPGSLGASAGRYAPQRTGAGRWPAGPAAMKPEGPQEAPPEAYVWVWLPGRAEPVVAARLRDYGRRIGFTYEASYLQRDDAIPLSLPDLPSRPGELMPRGGADMAGLVRDAVPESWGRSACERRLDLSPEDLSPLGYLLAGGSDRIGALDFQQSAERYVARSENSATLEELLEASRRVEDGSALSEPLRAALLQSTAVGGARPKALIADDHTGLLAKFPSSEDFSPVVQGEFVAMTLARGAGIGAAPVTLASAGPRWVLLVERFDRTPEGARRLVVSAETVLRTSNYSIGRGATGSYVALAGEIRSRFTGPAPTLRELFSRITYNILSGNHDDHLRNHAAFWDGTHLSLTPAYDICPQDGFGADSRQAQAYGADSESRSQVARCIEHARTYDLSPPQAREIVDHQIDVIRDNWHATCDRAELDRRRRDALWFRSFLHPGTCWRAMPGTRTSSRVAAGGRGLGDRQWRATMPLTRATGVSVAAATDIGPKATNDDRYFTSRVGRDGSWVIAVADGSSGSHESWRAAQAATKVLPSAHRDRR